MAADNIGLMLSRLNNLTKASAQSSFAEAASGAATRRSYNRTVSAMPPSDASQDRVLGFRKLNSVTTWWRSASNEKEPVAELRNNKSSAFDLLKDPAKELNQKLYVDYDQLQTEYKRLKSYIEHLEREYAECKELFDFFRRYQKLKGMIKRLIMYLKLSNNELIDANALHEEESSPGIIKLMQSTREFIKRSEMSKLRKQKHASMNSEELARENEELQSSIKATKRRIAMIKELITQLEEQYNGSKRYFPIQRYRLMKGMVKSIITNQLIRDNATA